MSSCTSSSSAARRFLAITLLGIVALELASALLLPVNPGRHEVDRRVAQLETLEGAPRAVLLSDSVSYGALDITGVPAGVLDLSSNQSIGVAGNVFLLRRLFERLEAQAPGSARGLRVVYALVPISYQADLDSKRFLEPYFTTVFTRPEEIASVAQLERPELSEKQRRGAAQAGLYPPSYRRRGVVQTPLALLLRALDQGRKVDLPVPAQPSRSAREEIAREGAVDQFEPSEVSRRYLPQLLELCAQHGAEVVLVHAPVPPSLAESWAANGYHDQYRGWLESVVGEAAHVELVTAPPLELGPDAAFYDGVHLLPGPRRAWARRLLTYLEAD